MRLNRSRLETDQKNFWGKGELAGGCAKATCHKLLNREIRTAEFAEFELLNFVSLFFFDIFRKWREKSPSKKMKSYCRTTRNNSPPPPISTYIFPIRIMVTFQEVDGKITEDSSKVANAGNLSNSGLVQCRSSNNNIYLLQLGCYQVAMVILHVNKTWNWLLLNLSREGYMRSM